MPCRAMPHPHRALPCHVRAMPCYAMLFYVMPWYAIPCYAMPYHTMLFDLTVRLISLLLLRSFPDQVVVRLLPRCCHAAARLLPGSEKQQKKTQPNLYNALYMFLSRSLWSNRFQVAIFTFMFTLTSTRKMPIVGRPKHMRPHIATLCNS